MNAAYMSAMPDHSRFLVPVDVYKGAGISEIRLLLGWADALRQGRMPMTR